MDWSLLGCGASGHITFEPDEPPLRERLGLATADGTAWRCLRCGTLVIGGPAYRGPAASAPKVRRGKEVRSALILRAFAVERFLRAIVFAALAYAIWRFKSSQLTIEQAFNHELPGLRLLFHELGYNVDHSRLLGLIRQAFTLNPRTLTYLAIGVAAYAAIEVIEGIGLWLVRRWGEYFAMVVTSIFLPYEVYDLSAKVTVLRAVAFAINLALVIYLLLTKRLFGIRGGKKAYEARLRSASIVEAELAALAVADDGQPARVADDGQPASQPAAALPATQPVAQPAGRPATGGTSATVPPEPAAHPATAGTGATAATEPAPAAPGQGATVIHAEPPAAPTEPHTVPTEPPVR
ncbi:MAG TPA: DUF2127 domain-containing protein [Streptosporangiaceae bacterium]|jgi:uncharacterized membrane protein (DUF2068 family)|nr:DUF2127 domain-containing protein [Streptosporangiaceae bacterium]